MTLVERYREARGNATLYGQSALISWPDAPLETTRKLQAESEMWQQLAERLRMEYDVLRRRTTTELIRAHALGELPQQYTRDES